MAEASFPRHWTRREALSRMGSGFGLLALARLLQGSSGPLDPKPPHFPAKAKHVILIMLNGGLSQVDTFDPKPALARHDGQPVPGGAPKTERITGNLMRSPFRFEKRGQSGIAVSEIFQQVGACIDEFCVIRSMHTNVPNHEPSLFMMNCGAIQPGRPAMGSWLTYGLGTENLNLPGFVVLCPGVPVVGPPLWESAFLPAVFQATHIQNNQTDPRKLIPFIESSGFDLKVQRRQIDLLRGLNQEHSKSRGEDSRLEATIATMETAYRMQTEAPEVFDTRKEPEKVRARYGDSDFGRGCLMALRLVESGVRMVQIYFGDGQPWDNHEDILIHRKLAQAADPAIGALIDDLKVRGLLSETLVIVGSEFGRTPAVEVGSTTKVHNGRDHNSLGFTLLLAGGGVKGGMTYGATDDFGFRAVEKPVHIHDLHATVLHLLGLDHTKLTYHYSGRDFRLTDVHGHVIHEIIA